MKYTIVGDVNLDGTVSIADFIDLAAHFNTTSGATWQSGDVNADGAVTIADFIDLASNFGKSLAGEALPVSPQDQALLDSFAAAIVPEPAMMLSLLLMGLCKRRRR